MSVDERPRARLGLRNARPSEVITRLATNQAKALRERVLSEWGGRRQHDLFDRVEKYAFFLGFPRSGHTLVGAMLNAHSEIVMAHEVDALRLVRAGYSRDGLFEALLRGDERFERRGWSWEGFDYAIPGQYQGRWTTLSVIGDKKGGGSALALQDDPELLVRLRDTVGIPMRAIVAVRNPFDNIARMALSSSSPLLGSIWSYRQRLQAVEVALDELDPGAFVVLQHEKLVSDPTGALAQLTELLGVPYSPEWAESSAKLVFPSPRRARDQIEWTPAERGVVEEMIERSSVLAGYGFDDG